MSKFQIFAVAGKPIIHSKSPILFNSYFKNNDRCYIRIANDDVKELVEIIKSLSIEGVNITAPFKMAIMPYLDEYNEKAINIGAVNLVLNKKGKLIGYNTDIDGIKYSLINSGISFKDKICLVFGAGGAASAAVFIAVSEGAKVIILNRTVEKAETIAKKFNCDYDSLDNLNIYIKKSDIIINTIPIENFNSDLLKKNQVLLNADYKKKIFNENFKLIGGRKWLIAQAVSSFRLFTNEKISYSMLDKFFDNGNNKIANNISLVGFAGSGKTEIGKSLAKKLNFDFIDTDVLVEKKTSKTINSIFKNKGEKYFRKIESEILESLVGSKNKVIATGGGIVLSRNNKEILKKISDVFWIYSPIEICYSRLSESINPPTFDIKKNKMIKFQDFENVFNNRIADYCKASEVLIYNNKTIEKAVNRIYYEINSKIRNKR